MANNFLAPTVAKASGGYPKVALGRGKGLMDWIRLTNSGGDLAGTKGKHLEVTQADLDSHNKQKNAWIVINGNVYNVGPYMEYHPGGVEELMRGAGIDGTELFNEIHPWVNYESMLKACFVGKFVGSAGDKIEVSDPEGSFQVDKLDSKETLVMLAAGTGFTPMVKLISQTGGTHKNLTRRILVLFNKKEEDIPWEKDLSELAKGSLDVFHVLSDPGTKWKGPRGRISQQLLNNTLSLSNLRNPYFCICGPTAFTELAFEILMNLGYSDDQVHAFQG